MQAKAWEDLKIIDDFLFGKVMRDPELCQKMLEIILDIKIERIEYPEEQKTIDIAVDAKSVRLDIYVMDEQHTVYNVEMQTTNKDNLPRRSRYYQSMIDLDLIEKGAYYKDLKNSIVIFICTFDLFGLGRHIYTFKNFCQEDKDLCLGDDTTKVFLNAAGIMDDVSGDLKAFLEYIAGNVPENDFVQALDSAVETAKRNEDWRREYMTLLMRDKENFEKGIETGEDRMSNLTKKLLKEKRYDDLDRATEDKKYQEELFKKYQL